MKTGAIKLNRGTAVILAATWMAIAILSSSWGAGVSMAAAPKSKAGFSVSPTTVTFGNQAVGTTSTSQTATLTNVGNAALSITGIAVSGTNAGDFVQTNKCGSRVGAGAKCRISMTFKPSATGTRTATLIFTDNASGSPQRVSLTGTGTAPVASLSPASLTFGNESVDTTSSSQVVTLNNTGSAALSITSIAFTGADATDFTQVDTCGASVAAGGNCMITILFTPSATGTRVASLGITDNASGSPQPVSLSGTGTEPGPTGHTYYVDNCVVIGSDANNGTSTATPWLTINKVNTSTFNPGDSILFESTCTWREQLTVPSSGSAGSPITFGAYGSGAAPIISGADIFSSWITEGSLYYSVASVQPNQVFRDNQRLNLAASKAALATDQWWWDSVNLRIYVYDNPSGQTMEASQRNCGILASSENYVTIQGLTVAKTNGSGILFNTSSNAAVNHSTITDTAGYGIQDATTSCNGFSFSNNVIAYTGDNGIGVDGCNNGAIYGNNVSHSGILIDDRSGISIFEAYGSSIYNNVSHDHTDQTGPVGIRCFVLDTIGTLGTNYLYDNLGYNCNGGGAHVILSTGQHVYSNVLYNMPSGGNAYVDGIKDVGSTGTLIYGNTLYNNQFSQIDLDSSDVDAIVKNNILVGTGSQYGLLMGSSSGQVTDYNLVSGVTNLYDVAYSASYSTAAAYYAATGNGQHDQNGEPNFANASAAQFWLTSGSPAIDAGTNLGSPYNIGLLPASSWPNSVLTGDQNSYGTGWEVGAYIFTSQ